MIKNPKLLQIIEDEYLRKNKVTIEKKYEMLEQMYYYANSLKREIPEDPLGNLNALVELARKIHSVPQVIVKNCN